MEKPAKKKKRRKKKALNIETSDDKDATSASIEKSEDSEGIHLLIYVTLKRKILQILTHKF